MKKDKTKELLIEQLKKTPIVQIACEKIGLGRATFYRWKKENKEFAKDADEAITEGEMLITDMSESQLISLVRDKNFAAIQLWLRHHHPKYAQRIEISGNINQPQEELNPEQEAIVRDALRLAALVFPEEKKAETNQPINQNIKQNYEQSNEQQSNGKTEESTDTSS